MIGFSIDLTTFFSYFARKREAKREVRLRVCRDALASIINERRNFTHIVKNRPFSSDPLHKTAVTVYSFERLRNAMNGLGTFRKFRGKARSMLRLVQQRDAAGILRLMDQVQPKLEKWINNNAAGETMPPANYF